MKEVTETQPGRSIMIGGPVQRSNCQRRWRLRPTHREIPVFDRQRNRNSRNDGGANHVGIE